MELKKKFKVFNFNIFKKQKKNSSESLQVVYKDRNNKTVKVGTLKHQNNKFTFVYDIDCEHKIEGLASFVDKSYLHPFFETRMPSSQRPNIADIYQECNGDPIKILLTLGKKSSLSKYQFESEDSN